MSTNAVSTKTAAKPNFSPNSFESSFQSPSLIMPDSRSPVGHTKSYNSTYEDSMPRAGVAFSIKGSLKIDDGEIKGIEEEKEEDEEEKFNNSSETRLIAEQSFHYKKGQAQIQREISNRQPANVNTLDRQGCCTLPFMKPRSNTVAQPAKEVVYSGELGGFSDVKMPERKQTVQAPRKQAEFQHFSKASAFTDSGRFYEEGPGDYKPAEGKNKDECLIF